MAGIAGYVAALQVRVAALGPFCANVQRKQDRLISRSNLSTRAHIYVVLAFHVLGLFSSLAVLAARCGLFSLTNEFVPVRLRGWVWCLFENQYRTWRTAHIEASQQR